MNARVLFVAIAACCVVGAAVLAFVLLRSPEPPAETAVARSVTAPRPAPPVPATPPADRAVVAPLSEAPREVRAEPVPPVAEPAPAPSPQLGVLRIETDVPGAQVFIDRRFVGAAPVTAENITPGSHQLNVSAEGFESIAMPIEVTTGSRDVLIRFREVRLDAAIDVVHRHGIGSCRGQLIASPRGIRYETTNRGDAFSSDLLALDTFEVDYLEKNLRLRLPKGRQFNFTDPDGNADRLFVFHRDVEKARERLRKGDVPAAD